MRRYKLDNGVRIVCEKLQHVRSVSVGIWIAAGSKKETIENNGISHFIEHMLFKGTDKRSAKEIAEAIDNIGGQINAFTGKECTCFYAKVLDSHIDIAFDVLADMFFNSKMDQKDIDVEKKVIVEEINMYEDSPEELAHDVLHETVWSKHSLGLSILGTEESLEKIDRHMLFDYKEKNYIPENVVIAVAGNFEHGYILDLVKKYFKSWEAKSGILLEENKLEFSKGFQLKDKDIEQVHICFGFEGVQQGDKGLYSLLAVNNILGGGMSSRLFQKIREEAGLVYSIYSYPSAYRNAGLFTIYMGMNPKNVPQVMDMVTSEIIELNKKGFPKNELKKSKEQLRGSYILGLESTSSRMNSIGKSEVILKKIYKPEEILSSIDDITMDTVDEVIRTVFDTENIGLSVVGNIKNNLNFEKYLKFDT